ncbi:MAG: patatin-like phospholipase family protein [Synergistaceae bacterium]|nr:patatin-like phospholipase family protein [Synergistota bacterium]NLM71995.1 patatin-like phospholipase family protein [Synergistaceae bacterium]
MSKKRLLTALIMIQLVLCGPASARMGGVVLALSGGGARGLAHIGVLEALGEQGIPIAGIVGTSMGSIIGGLAASGYSPDELRHVVEELDLTNLMSERTNPIFVPLPSDNISPRSSLPWVRLSQSGEVIGPLGGITGVKLLERFAQLASRIHVVRFDELPIPFAAVATDLETGEKVVLRAGSLASAMRASMAIPAIFEPWPLGDRLLVDGGLVSNLPVETAKELFPGYPVIAVDVTGQLRSKKEIRNLVDVVDQSITIFTSRNVEWEKPMADLLISPPVEGVSIFDLVGAENVIDGGRRAALEVLPEIIALSESAPSAAQPEFFGLEANVSSIEVEGASMELASAIVKKYGAWIGRPLSSLEVLKASRQIGERDDVLSVDYRFEARGPDVGVVFIVQRKPALEINFGGYTTNLHPQRWLYVSGIRRYLFREGDALKFNLRIGDQWGVDASYFDTPELKPWEIRLSAYNWELEPENAEKRSWDRYALGFYKHFTSGEFTGGAGYAVERTHSRGEEFDSHGPTLFLTSDTLNDPVDPTEGALLHLQAWWANLDELLYRITYFRASRFADDWRFYFRAGFAEGNVNHEGHAVYLGAAEELYSYSGNPIEAERMAWWNVAFRRVMMKSWWGALNTEIFGGMGFAFDDDWNRFRDLWEAGVSFSIPGVLFDGKLMFIYNDEKDFKIGFFLGSPVWGKYPLP